MNALNPFLITLGWNDFFQAGFTDGAAFGTGRITSQGRGHYQVQISADEILEAAITTKFHDLIKDPTGFPAVGDWVVLQRGQGNQQATIHRVLDRKTTIQRKKSGAQPGVQMIAANVDFLFIVSSMNEDFDLSRLGRYIELGRESGCETILLLTKSDLSESPAEYIQKFKDSFPGIDTFAISSEDPASMDCLKKYFTTSKTCLLLGSSGVGKSTLTNHLLGFQAQKTGGLSSESKGRHTTTARNLRFTRWGGMVIDTPGMQEIFAVDSIENLKEDFSEIEELKLLCKFTDCTHKSEPGCAILAGLKNGSLQKDRWNQYLGVVSTAGRRQKKNKYSR